MDLKSKRLLLAAFIIGTILAALLGWMRWIGWIEFDWGGFVGAVVTVAAAFWLAQMPIWAERARREARQPILNELWLLREEGVRLRNQSIEPVQVEAWLGNSRNWTGRVYAAAEKISPNLRFHLETLNEVGPPPEGVHTHDAEHLRGVRIVSEILRRLERYLEKFL